MINIVVGFHKDDEEINLLLKEQFGDVVQLIQSSGFDGSEIFFTAIIPIASLTTQIIDFFLSHFSKKSGKGRVLITKDEIISIEGYNADETKKIIEAIYNGIHHND
jgi:hypothetical protein